MEVQDLVRRTVPISAWIRGETGMMSHVTGPLNGSVKRELPSVGYDYVELQYKTDLISFFLCVCFYNMGLCLTLLKSGSM